MATYHIHIDASWISPLLEKRLLDEVGFVRMDFDRHLRSGDGECIAPERHLTLKLNDPVQFKKIFRSLTDDPTIRNQVTGYFEGEYIPLDVDIAQKPFDPTVRIPFRLEMGELPPGRFRETEVHITMDRDRSDPALKERIKSMGFYSVYLEKPYGYAQIFTAQGSRRDVGEIINPLIEYLHRAGGSVMGTIKEERIARWWISHPDVPRPPVIRSIKWLDLLR